MRRQMLIGLAIALGAATLDVAQFELAADEAGFKRLDDGKSFAGWKASEHAETWKVEDGAFVAHGPRSHLFYVGDDKPFVDFELKVDVKTEPHSNGGIYFHTKYQETGWPKHGFEVQVNNTYDKDPRKSGSLYQVQDVLEQKAKDGEWYVEHVIVRGKRVIVKLNDETVVDYAQPDGKQPGEDFTRVVGSGTFALQAHDPDSTVRYKNIRVKRLD
ncbi:MAG TPA: DUF1080 domain-containing protein [Pirellulales bacterium]|nr:DUF1080 domain-containing protein [Pirellulales bacterium]